MLKEELRIISPGNVDYLVKYLNNTLAINHRYIITKAYFYLENRYLTKNI